LELGNFEIESTQNFPIVLSKILLSFCCFSSIALQQAFLGFVAFAGLDLPNEPWNLFPFAVFLSPLPMIFF
jgi:hypothetical protein